MSRLLTLFFPKNRKPKEYFQLFIGESSLGDICALFDNLPLEKKSVNGKIRFQRLSFGISPFRTRLIMGCPDCRHKFTYKTFKHKIYTYNNIGRFHGLIANCHFFNNRLHYIQTCIRHPDAAIFEKLTGLFERHFGYQLKNIHSSFALSNGKGEVLFFHYNVYINIYHFSANRDIEELIRREYINQEIIINESKQKEINVLEEII